MPEGPYPQPPLYLQVGSAPIKRRTRITSNIVPSILDCSFSEKNSKAKFSFERKVPRVRLNPPDHQMVRGANLSCGAGKTLAGGKTLQPWEPRARADVLLLS
jgi:hypothetical protein